MRDEASQAMPGMAKAAIGTPPMASGRRHFRHLHSRAIVKVGCWATDTISAARNRRLAACDPRGAVWSHDADLRHVSNDQQRDGQVLAALCKQTSVAAPE
jgi:hypothetical protein